jgi:molecular chaperone DnaK
VEKSAKEWADKLDANLKSRLDGAVDTAKQALRSGNPEEISKALDALQQAYSAAGASLHAAARGAGPEGAPGAGAPGGQPEGAADTYKQENVVDADYEIVDDDKKKA